MRYDWGGHLVGSVAREVAEGECAPLHAPSTLDPVLGAISEFHNLTPETVQEGPQLLKVLGVSHMCTHIYIYKYIYIWLGTCLVGSVAREVAECQRTLLHAPPAPHVCLCRLVKVFDGQIKNVARQPQVRV